MKRVSEVKERRIGIRLTESEYRKLLSESSKRGLSISDYIRELLMSSRDSKSEE